MFIDASVSEKLEILSSQLLPTKSIRLKQTDQANDFGFSREW